MLTARLEKTVKRCWAEQSESEHSRNDSSPPHERQLMMTCASTDIIFHTLNRPRIFPSGYSASQSLPLDVVTSANHP